MHYDIEEKFGFVAYQIFIDIVYGVVPEDTKWGIKYDSK